MKKFWVEHYGSIIVFFALVELLFVRFVAQWLALNPVAFILSSAVIIGISHMIIFWRVHQRMIAMQIFTIGRTQEMLKDGVLNQLALISSNMYLLKQKPETQTVRIQRIEQAVIEISQIVDHLSADNVNKWHSKADLLPPRD